MSSSLPPDQRFDGTTEPGSTEQAGSPFSQTAPQPTPQPGPEAYPPYPPYQTYQPYQPYQPAPGYEPPPVYQQTPQPPSRGPRVPPWALGVVALVLVLAGIGVGLALSRNNNPAATSLAVQPVATLPVPAAAQDLQQQVIDVIHAVQPTVVQVQSQGSQGQAIGSGEIVTSDGYIVTNDHVVRGFSQYSVLLSNGKTYPATLRGEAPQDDLAVLKISTGTSLQTISFGDSNKAQVGQFAIALGSPLGLQQSATLGIVSALNRSASEGANGPAQELTGLIQTSAPINPGNSGGALVNLQGQLIGIPTLGAVDPNSGSSANGIGFAIPSDRVQFVMEQLIKNGQLVTTGQGFIGIQGEDVTPQLASSYNLGAQSGVLIVGFAQAANGTSPAQQAGLKQGDIITQVDGQSIAGNSDLASALLSKSPGTQVKITFVRGSSTSTVTVTLGERPTNAG